MKYSIVSVYMDDKNNSVYNLFIEKVEYHVRYCGTIYMD
jgi:hypothetical protein